MLVVYCKSILVVVEQRHIKAVGLDIGKCIGFPQSASGTWARPLPNVFDRCCTNYA